MSNVFTPGVHAQSRSNLLRLPLLCLALLCLSPIGLPLGSLLVSAQDAETDEKPKQTGLSAFTEPFQHKDEPAFAYHIPAKKKYAKYTDRFRKVDLAARRDAALANIDKAIEAEEAKADKDDLRLNELKVQKRNITVYYDRTKLLLEVEGDANEYIRIQVAPVQETRVKIDDVQPRGQIERRWKRVEVMVDKNKTSKSERKKNRQAHSLMLKGTPENSTDHGWWRFETRLVPSKDKTQLYQLTYVHRMDASKFDKKTAKDAEVLSRFWLVP